MITPTIEGLEGAPFPIWIEAGKVREFARAVHAFLPAHLDLEPAPIIPPTFLTTVFLWEREVDGADLWPRIQMDPKRGMHAEQEYEFYGPPPRAGERLTAQSKVERVYQKAGRRGGALTFVEIVTRFHDADGRLVAEAKLTAVETAHAPGDGSPSAPAERA